MFSETESLCIDNCVRKIFGSEKMIRAYIPLRIKQTGNLSMKEVERRLNNPSDSYGHYFTAF
jgi:hypothetical protein